MTDTKRNDWLVYDRREGKFLKEFGHPTNYVDEASRFSYDEARELVVKAALGEWRDGKPPKVMISGLGLDGMDLSAQAKAAGLLIKAATERMIADRATADWSHPVPVGGLPEESNVEPETATSLIDQARAAYEQADAVRDVGYERERAHRIAIIGDALAKLGLTPSGQPFTNSASHRVCVPLINGGWDDERDMQIHSVAAEWDDDTDEPGLVLVADLDVDEDWRAKELYPAGRLDGLADLGRAIQYGGSTVKDSRVPTISDLVNGSISAARNAAWKSEGYEADVMVHAADAICTALLDVAAAIRETAGS